MMELKKCLYVVSMLFGGLLYAQQPVITGIDITAGTINEEIGISGSGFVTGALVYFGVGESADVTVENNNLIRAIVPPTATSGPITVVNPNGSSGISLQHFSPSFDIDAQSQSYTLGSSVLGAAGLQYTYDLCLCDFDENGILDIAVTNNAEDGASTL